MRAKILSFLVLFIAIGGCFRWMMPLPPPPTPTKIMPIFTPTSTPSPAPTPPSRPSIAFISDRGGQIDVWVMGEDGGGQMKITDDRAKERQPVWSPGGGKIAYVSEKEGEQALWVYDFEKGESRRLESTITSSGVILSPFWTADGKSLIYAKKEGRKLMLESVLVGPDEVRRLEIPFNEELIFGWSTNGQLLTIEARRDYETVEVFLGSLVQREIGPLTKVVEGCKALISPDGGRIVYHYPPFDDDPATYVSDVISGEAFSFNETDITRRWDHDFSWSPKGIYLVFLRSSVAWTMADGTPRINLELLESPGMGDEGLYIVDIASREKRRLTDKPCDLSPVWGPDGRYILFVSNRTDPSGLDIWKLDVEGGELVNLTKGKGKNWSPAWSKE